MVCDPWLVTRESYLVNRISIAVARGEVWRAEEQGKLVLSFECLVLSLGEDTQQFWWGWSRVQILIDSSRALGMTFSFQI